MIDKLSWFFIDKVYAQTGLGGLGGAGGAVAGSEKAKWFGVFNPFNIGSQNTDATLTFSKIVGIVMGWVLAIVAIIAFVYLIISGVNYITAGGDAEKATKARAGILNAIIGIVVVVLSYFILRFAANLGNNIGK